MIQAKYGDTVAVQYTGTLNDGTPFETTDMNESLRFMIGKNELIPPARIRAIQQAVLGMKVGESRRIRVPASDAYGFRDEGLVAEVNRDKFPADLKLRVGMELEVYQGDDTIYPTIVTDITASIVTLDANHPLAGKDLIFDIVLIEIM